jgi:hypothetical protein
LQGGVAAQVADLPCCSSIAGNGSMMRRRDFNSFLAASLSSKVLDKRVTATPPVRKILAVGDVHRKIYQHGSFSHAAATIFDLGRSIGSFDTYIRTDIQPLTKHPITFPAIRTLPDVSGNDVSYKTLNDVDAIFFYGIGELEVTDQQKADLLSFIRDDGKGFVRCPTAINAFPHEFVTHDEIYQVRNCSRDRVRTS